MAEEHSASKSTTLRAELKEWERAFAAANGERKPGRADIKKDPAIAAKYKEYGQSKSLESSSNKGTTTSFHDSVKTTVPLKLEERPKKRKRASPARPGDVYSTSTPRKTAKGIFATPSKPSSRISDSHPSQLDPYDSPSSIRRLFSPSTHQQNPSPLRTAVGPTPQRDGKALGLFDLLSESGGSTATPTANRLAEHNGSVAQTPTKKRGAMATIREEEEDDDLDDNNLRNERSPASYSLTNLFATPTTLRYAAMVETDDNADLGNRTTTTTNNNNNDVGRDSSKTEKPSTNEAGGDLETSIETPVFLRRYNPVTSNSVSNGPNLSPTAVRKPPPFVGKGLSAIVRGLREMEKERVQEDWNVLEEIEAEKQQQKGEGEEENVHITDSQRSEKLPNRLLKKKAPKRTTRKAVLKPVIPRPKSAPQRNDCTNNNGKEDRKDSGEDNENDEDELATIPDIQRDAVLNNNNNDEHDSNDNNDNNKTATKPTLRQRPRQNQDKTSLNDDTTSYHTISEPDTDPEADSGLDSDYVDEPESAPKLPKPKSFAEKIREAVTFVVKGNPNDDNDTPGAQQKVTKPPQSQSQPIGKENENKKPCARKVNPDAHANYRALRIRNKGSKGRNAGRFRRW